MASYSRGAVILVDITLVEQGIARKLGFDNRPSVLHESTEVYELETGNRE